MKSLNKVLLAAALALSVTLTYAKPLPVAKAYSIEIQDRHLSGFSSVNVAGSFDVYITQGSTESVKVEADDEVIDKIITEVKGGVLKIYTKSTNGFSWNWSGDRKRVVRVTAKDLSAISLTGSGDVYFKDGIRTQNLIVNLSGSGDITGKIDVKNLQTAVVGSGDITLTGRADNSVVKVSGSGDYSGRNLISINATVRVVGSGDASVNVSDKLDASVAGSGDVHYTGAAKNVATSKSGSGDISKF
ncbi:head GIN domain-containing protein [Mucilaginibacter terrae]|uniref:head GIN domain-containing protein n=1 Tax=Mucilaginibacter terrae TaxID=1955052 RepID=UPI003636E28E